MSSEAKTLIEACVREVESSPHHILSAESRRRVYDTLWPLRHSGFAFFEDLRRTSGSNRPKWYGSFARFVVLTAQYSLPVWERFVDQATAEKRKSYELDGLPYKMLDVAWQVLADTMNADDASALLCSDFYLGMSGVNHLYPYPVSRAVLATYDALDMTLYGNFRDIAWNAVEAYTAFDENGDGVWAQNYFPISSINPKFYAAYFLDEDTVNDRMTGYPSIYLPPIPIRYDEDKRLEFWRWWLTEAIPTALDT